jgi:hypothetical protein
MAGNGTAGNPLTFVNGTAVGQVWQWNGAAWVLNTVAGDNWGTQTAVASGPITGNGTAGNPLTFANGAVAGQVWQWNGAAWVLATPTATVTTSGPLQGDGSAGNPVTFDPGTADGQVWLWDGSAWILTTLPTMIDVADIDGLIGIYNPATNVLDIDALVNNGLSISAGDSIGMGGTLVRNTTVAMAGANFAWQGQGRMGIGSLAPAALVNKLHIQNDAATGVTATSAVLVDNSNTGATHGLSAFTNSNTATTAAIRGEHLHATNNVYGVAGQVTTTNRNAAAVLGNATSNAYGVFGQNTNAAANGGIGVGGVSLTSQGVYAQTSSTTNVPVTIGGTAFTGAAGLFAYSSNAGGSGAILAGDGMALATNLNYLLNGTGSNNNGFDVGSFHWAATGVSTQAIGQFTTYNGASFGIANMNVGFFGAFVNPLFDGGVWGSAFDFGVGGETGISVGWGVIGLNSDPDDLFGFAGASVGTQGEGWFGVVGFDVSTFGDGVGVYGEMGGPLGWAVLANGDFGATGGKFFVIDHPDDPANRLLRHASIESNEILNVYRGTVTLDANGEAVVELPHYFERINRNFSYHLTAVGGQANLYVKEKIQGNKFRVAGGFAGLEVSWQVYAERNDPYMQQNPTAREMEVNKPDRWRGRYLRPELYGQPATMGMVQRSQLVGEQNRRTAGYQRPAQMHNQPMYRGAIPTTLQMLNNQETRTRSGAQVGQAAPPAASIGLHSDATRPAQDGIIR